MEDWNDNMGHAQAIRLNLETGFLEGGQTPAATAPLSVTDSNLSQPAGAEGGFLLFK